MSTVKKALLAVAGCQLTPLDTRTVTTHDDVKYTFDDLPIRKITDDRKGNSYTHLFEVVDNIRTADPEGLLQGVVSGEDIPMEFQIPDMTYVGNMNVQQFLVPKGDNLYRLIKHYHFSPRVYFSKFATTAAGDPYALHGENLQAKRILPQMIQHFLVHLGGYGITNRTLQTPEVEKKLMSTAEIDAGFDYVQENAPMTTSNNELARWIMKQKNMPESPIFSWSSAQIERAANNLISDKSLSRMVSVYPLSFKDVKNWVLTDILPTCLKHCQEKAIFFAGHHIM